MTAAPVDARAVSSGRRIRGRITLCPVSRARKPALSERRAERPSGSHQGSAAVPRQRVVPGDLDAAVGCGSPGSGFRNVLRPSAPSGSTCSGRSDAGPVPTVLVLSVAANAGVPAFGLPFRSAVPNGPPTESPLDIDWEAASRCGRTAGSRSRHRCPSCALLPPSSG